MKKFAFLVLFLITNKAYSEFNVVFTDTKNNLEWSQALPDLYSNGCTGTSFCFVLGVNGSALSNFNETTQTWLNTPEDIAANNQGQLPVIDTFDRPYRDFFRVHPQYSDAAAACENLGTKDHIARLPTGDEYNKLKYGNPGAIYSIPDMNRNAYWVANIYQTQGYFNDEDNYKTDRLEGLIWYRYGDLVSYGAFTDVKHQVRCVRDLLSAPK